MGLLYDIFYSGRRDFDREVGSRVLDLLSEQVQAKKQGYKNLIGAVAVIKNGEQGSMTLCADGEWR